VLKIYEEDKMMKKLFRFFLILFLAAGLALLAQENPQSKETESNVPELIAFHKVIYPIWHDSFPKKDYEALRSYVKEINSLAEGIYAAQLPGILRDKEARWKEGVAGLKRVVDDYNRAAEANDDEGLLKAAEALHSRYEMLVRLIRPVIQEVDQFHKVFYVIYHKYLADNNYQKIKSASGDLLLKAEGVTKAKLPKGLEAKAEQFGLAAEELYRASKELKEKCDSGTESDIKDAVNKVHSRYQSLEKIFE